MPSPYAGRPKRSFWKTGVAGKRGPRLAGLYQPRFEITPQTEVATAGSCFAQHITGQLRSRSFKVLDAEPAPEGLSTGLAARFGYGVYSARYGNIYTARQLLQLAQEAFGGFAPQDIAWQRDGRWFDALRPGVEPEGLDSAEEVHAHRARHLARVRDVFSRMEVMVFTFGLTEAWLHRASGTVYPTAPETIAGTYSPDVHAFHNFGFGEVLNDFLAFRELVHSVNPACRFLLTVSPVPLAATATDAHVLPATIHSKAVLRAVCGELCARFEDVDYFPSFEIVGTPFVGDFYGEDLRSVTPDGVAAVMSVFFGAHGGEAAAAPDGKAQRRRALHADRERQRTELGGTAPADLEALEETACEEQLLAAFAR